MAQMKTRARRSTYIARLFQTLCCRADAPCMEAALRIMIACGKFFSAYRFEVYRVPRFESLSTLGQNYLKIDKILRTLFNSAVRILSPEEYQGGPVHFHLLFARLLEWRYWHPFWEPQDRAFICAEMLMQVLGAAIFSTGVGGPVHIDEFREKNMRLYFPSSRSHLERCKSDILAIDYLPFIFSQQEAPSVSPLVHPVSVHLIWSSLTTRQETRLEISTGLLTRRVTLHSGTQSIRRQELYCVTTVNSDRDHTNSCTREQLPCQKLKQCLFCEQELRSYRSLLLQGVLSQSRIHS